MERLKVKSHNLSSVGYDSENSVLEVEFKNGKVYQYFGVSPDVYGGLMGGKSLGKYFYKNIRNLKNKVV